MDLSRFGVRRRMQPRLGDEAAGRPVRPREQEARHRRRDRRVRFPLPAMDFR